MVETVSQALEGLWHFRQFMSSRWRAVGMACRSLVAALLSCVESLVTFARKQAHFSEFHLGGWDRLMPQVRKFVVMAGMTAESVLALLMEDPQALQQVALIRNTIESWNSSMG